MQRIIRGRACAIKICLAVSATILPSSALARNYMGGSIASTSTGQVEAVTGRFIVPPNPPSGMFRSFNLNLQGFNYIVQAVVATTFDDGNWYMNAEIYDAWTGSDTKWNLTHVNPNDVLDLGVFRLWSNGSAEQYEVNLIDRTSGAQAFPTMPGPRPMLGDSHAVVMFEFENQNVTCHSLGGQGFTHLLVSEDLNISYPWSWPSNLSNVQWIGDNVTPFEPGSGVQPVCTYQNQSTYFQSLGYGYDAFQIF